MASDGRTRLTVSGSSHFMTWSSPETREAALIAMNDTAGGTWSGAVVHLEGNGFPKGYLLRLSLPQSVVQKLNSASAISGFLKVLMSWSLDIGMRSQVASSTKSVMETWNDFLAVSGQPSVSQGQGDIEITRAEHEFLLSSNFAMYSARASSALDVGALLRGQSVAQRGHQISGFSVAALVAKLRARKQGDLVLDPTFLEIAKAVDSHDLQAARTALQAVPVPSSRAITFYGAQPGKGISEQSLSDRRQAASAMPVLADLIAETADLAARVDRRESIQPVLQELTGLSKGALKRLGKVTAAIDPDPAFERREDVRGENALGVDMERLFHFSGRVDGQLAMETLSSLPPDWVPDTNEDWIAFHDCLFAIAAPYAFLSGEPLEEVLKTSKGKWSEWKSALARAADIPVEQFDRRRMALAMTDAAQGLQDLAMTAILPLAITSVVERGLVPLDPDPSLTTHAFGAALDVVRGNSKNPVSALLEMSRRHISRIPALTAAIGVPDDGGGPSTTRRGSWGEYLPGSWPKMTAGDHVAPNGLVVRCLNTIELLVRESEQLGHCVGRLYLSKSEKGDCHIYSVQRGEASLSTFEVQPFEGEEPRDLRIVQHQGMRNSQPAADCVEALNWFRAAVRDGDIPIAPGLPAWRRMMATVNLHDTANRGPQVTWASVTGVHDVMYGSRSEIWGEWRNILGGSNAKSEHPGILFRSAAVRDMVSLLNSDAARLMMEEARQNTVRQPASVPETTAGDLEP